MDCFGTYFTHVQNPNVTRVQSATQCTASVHTLHMSKPDVTRGVSKPDVTRVQWLAKDPCHKGLSDLFKNQVFAWAYRDT